MQQGKIVNTQMHVLPSVFGPARLPRPLCGLHGGGAEVAVENEAQALQSPLKVGPWSQPHAQSDFDSHPMGPFSKGASTRSNQGLS